jgi:uncharacterized membrane protein YccC
MPPVTKDTAPIAVPIEAKPKAHAGAGEAFWQLLTYFDSTKLTPFQGLRNAIGVALPLVVGYAIGMPRGGLVVASGALNVSYSDGSDPYLERAKRMLAASALCAMAVFAGAISGRHTLFAVMVATVWAFAAGMFVAVGGAAPNIGVISLVTLLIYSAQHLTACQAVMAGVLALAGGLLQTALSIALWPVRRYEPERRTMGNFYWELAQAAERLLVPGTAPQATLASSEAQKVLSALGRDATLEGIRYRALLSQAERIRLSLLMLSRLRLRMERESPSHQGVEILDRYLRETAEILRAVGETLQGGERSGVQKEQLTDLDALAQQLRSLMTDAPACFLTAVVKDARFQMDALSGQLRAALDLAGKPTLPNVEASAKLEVSPRWQARFSGRIATLRANLNLNSSAYRHAVRLAVLVAMGVALGRAFSWHRSYWLPMTIVLVLRPEFTATFTRGLLRIAGTIVGLFVATALFHFVPANIAVQIMLIFCFTYLLRWLGPANYGIFAIAVSALVVLLIAVKGEAPKEVIWARGINTVAGGALALAAYWLWPTWERTQVPERIAQMLDAYREYFHTLSEMYQQRGSADPRKLESNRLAGHLARSNLEASIDRLSAEPGTTAEVMNRLNEILASSHRFVHAVMALDARNLQSSKTPARPPFGAFAANVEKTLSILADTLRGRRTAAKDLPDLRESYHRLVEFGDPLTERYALVNVEADRMTNSLNTLSEGITTWVRTRN